MADKKVHVTETPNATYYDVHKDNSDLLMQSIIGAVQQTMQGFTRTMTERDAIKQHLATMNPDEQKHYIEALTPKDKKRLGLENFQPRAKTPDEEAASAQMQAQAKIATTEAANIDEKTQLGLAAAKLSVDEIRQRLLKGEIDLRQAQHLEAQYNDPNTPNIQRAFILGLRGSDADKWAISQTHPDMADAVTQISQKVGPEYEKRLVPEIYQTLVTATGQVDPKYTLKTATAMAKGLASGDMSEMDALQKDPNFPQSMKTLAFQRFMLDKQQMLEARATRESSKREQRAGLVLQFMSLVPGVGPQAAQQGVDAVLEGRATPEWIKPKIEAAQALVRTSKEAQMAKDSVEMKVRMEGISDIRDNINSLRQLVKDGIDVGKNTSEIHRLTEQMKARTALLYGIKDVDKADSSWFKDTFNASLNLAIGAGQVVKGALSDYMSGESVKDMKMLPQLDFFSPDLKPAEKQGGRLTPPATPAATGDAYKMAVSQAERAIQLIEDPSVDPLIKAAAYDDLKKLREGALK